jgi:hypothetical protein
MGLVLTLKVPVLTAVSLILVSVLTGMGVIQPVMVPSDWNGPGPDFNGSCLDRIGFDPSVMVPVLTRKGLVLTLMVSVWTGMGVILTVMVPVLTGMGVIQTVMVPILTGMGWS